MLRCRAKRLPHASPGNVISGNGLTEWGGAEWLLRHVQRRVQLTLGLRCRETGARLPPATAHDLPTTVLGLQRFRGERDHLGCRGTGEDHVHAAGAGATLQLGDQRLEPAGELLGDGPALRPFNGPEIVVYEEDLGVVRRDKQGGRERGRADHDGQVTGLEAAHRAHERAIRLEAPVRRGALRGAQGAVLLAPAGERRQPQPPGDDPVDMLEEEHLGEEVLACGAVFELAHRFVADLQQIFAGERVLVLLDALQQELLVFLLERARRPPRGPGALLPREAQHGSTCTVTSWSCRSRLRRSSTWSAIACADSTSAWRSTAIVTSA